MRSVMPWVPCRDIIMVGGGGVWWFVVWRYTYLCRKYKVTKHTIKRHKIDRAVKHWTMAASAGEYKAMDALRKYFVAGFVGRDSIDSTLAAYNNSCVEMRSKARDASICTMTGLLRTSPTTPDGWVGLEVYVVRSVCS